MYRSIAFAAALLTATAGIAQTADSLEIGYVKGSPRGDAIYLVSSDGTGETKVYQAPRTTRFGGQIQRLSLRPGGGELAFVLDFTQLMILRYDSSGQPTGEATEIEIAGSCGLGDPDYGSDGDLYVADSCGNMLLVDTDTSAVETVFSQSNIAALAAVGTSVLYAETLTGLAPLELKLRTSTGSTTSVTQIPLDLPMYIDAVGNVGVISGRTSYSTVNLTTGDVDTGCTTGGMVKYSPDGTQMVYEYRNMLLILNSDCSGSPFRLARGADSVAWRSN